jgi:hypothetical protein
MPTFPTPQPREAPDPLPLKALPDAAANGIC